MTCPLCQSEMLSTRGMFDYFMCRCRMTLYRLVDGTLERVDTWWRDGS